MKTILKTVYEKDETGKKLKVSRTFSAPKELVWRAWTESAVIDEWWAPKPWKTDTIRMEFRVGGSWLYAMKGPDGDTHYSKCEFKSIRENDDFEMSQFFCDVHGNKISPLPPPVWKIKFESLPDKNETAVTVEIEFYNAAQLEEMIKMGFEQGFAMSHNNLDIYLENKLTVKTK